MAKPSLHVSLGVLDIDNCIKLATKAFLSGAEVIEISNSLLKKHGIYIISEIRRVLPKAKIYADTKIIDNIDDEGKIIYEAGADIFSIHASVDEEEVLNRLSYIRKLGLEFSLDLTGFKDVLSKVLSISYLTPDYFYYKIPENISKNISNHPEIFRIIKDLVRISSAPLIIAGLNDLQSYSICARLGVSSLSIPIDEKNINNIEELVKEFKKAIEISFP